MPLKNGGCWPLQNGLLAEYRIAYPNLDVIAEARKARAWLASNTSRRKTKRGMPRFLHAWLARAERDRAAPAPARRNPSGRQRALAGGCTEEDRQNPDLWRL